MVREYVPAENERVAVDVRSVFSTGGSPGDDDGWAKGEVWDIATREFESLGTETVDITVWLDEPHRGTIDECVASPEQVRPLCDECKTRMLFNENADGWFCPVHDR